jgi:copper transport protein
VVTGRLASVCCAALALALLAPQGAAAHAVLESTSPARGAQLERAPARVVFRFDESVEVAFGALRVYDGKGERVDRGAAEHPGGRGDEVAVALRGGLGDGTYTATYRVISADSHPVSGGYVFTVGRGGAPAQSLDQLLDKGGTGTATEVGFGIVRGLSYVALALGIGGVAFVAAVWRPALRTVAGAGDEWRRASEAFAGRVRALVLGSALLGAAMSALGIAFQGAVASGTSLWQALDPTVIGDVLDTHFGTIWGLRLVVWLAVGGLVALPAARLRAPVLRPASLGATGLAPARPAAPSSIAALALLLGFLCLTPALAGHAWTLDPRWLLVPANFLHVACMCLWVGGVGVLLLALPAATRALEGKERTWLLAATVGRFSTIALFAVAGLIAGGVVQAIVELDSLSDLVDTAFGRAILIKIGLLLALVGLGAWNRQRARPRLESLAQAGETPGATGMQLRRSLRAEIALMATVLAVTAALVSYAPPTGATGPFSASETLGPARMALTVDPAHTGPNEIHLYLFDRRTGRQYARVKEMTVTARLPDHGIGPLPLRARKAGPGHYVIRRADFAPAGDWHLEVAARLSAFDLYTSHAEVPIK